jgi:hypothetical protein
VAVVTGAAGIGKTSLAVHWARRVAERFPDGRLYLDLRHGSVSAAEAIDEALRAFGIETDASGAAAAYRSLLGTRRVLVLLDNAGGDAQVGALVPESGPSAVLVTSRAPIATGAAVPLGAFGTGEATELLGAVAGAQRLADEPDGTAELARGCGHLPLALAVAGAGLAMHPERSVVEQVALVDAGRTADGAEPDELAAVRAAYHDLPAVDQRLLRLVAGAPTRDVTAETTAALADGTVPDVAQALARLAAAGLLAEPVAGRFVPHAPVRGYATAPDQARPTDPDDDQVATGRLFSHYLRAADAAARLLYPQALRLPMPGTVVRPDAVTFATSAEATTWLDAERPNLLAVIEHAAQHGPRSFAWLLADALRGYLAAASRTTDWRKTARWALSAAEADGAGEARSAAHLSLAELHLRASQHPDAWQEALRVLAAPASPVPAGPARHAAAARRVTTRMRMVIAALVALVVYVALAGSVPTVANVDAPGTGPDTVVSRWSVAGLRQDEAIDFDAAGRQSFDDVAGMDITPYGSGNHLTGHSDALLAWLPPKSPARYAGCAKVPVKQRLHVLHGLYRVPDGQRICVWTKPGRVAMITLIRAPRQQLPDLVFDYVVWRGGAPEPGPPVEVPPDKELDRYAVGNLTDEMGIDLDPGGGKAAADAPDVDVAPQTHANAVHIMSGALIALLPKGSPGSYAACAGVPADQLRVGVPGLYGQAEGTHMCVYLYSGRVALLTMSSVPSSDKPALDLYVVIWQGTNGARPVATEPPPWIRAPLKPGETSSKVRKTRQ